MPPIGLTIHGLNTLSVERITQDNLVNIANDNGGIELAQRQLLIKMVSKQRAKNRRKSLKLSRARDDIPNKADGHPDRITTTTGVLQVRANPGFIFAR